MKYYHMTKVEYLNEIFKNGLLPLNGKNSKMVDDDKARVFFSEDMQGAIGLTAAFQDRFDDLSEKSDMIGYSSLNEYLGESIYLSFDAECCENENEDNYINGYTKKEIPASKIQVCVLENMNNGQVTYQRDDIVKYMMANVPFEKAIPIYMGKKYDALLQKYYNDRQEDIESFHAEDYKLVHIDIQKFMKKYIEKDESVKSDEER